MQGHETPADGKAKARCIAVGAEAGFKDSLDEIRGNAAAGVGDLDNRAAALRMRGSPHGDFDSSPCRRVADGVADQVEDNLAEQVFIALNFQVAVPALTSCALTIGALKG